MTDTLTSTVSKKTRTPRQPESITKAVMELPLEEKVKLRDALIGAVNAEVAELKTKADQAATLAGTIGK